MEKMVVSLCVVPCAILFTGIGIFAWRRRLPMWFWSGSTVHTWQIRNIPAYNRANGIMWIIYAIPYWISGILGFWNVGIAVVILIAASVVGVPILIYAYGRIYKKYKT